MVVQPTQLSCWAYNEVVDTGASIFRVARIPLPTNLNIEAWHQLTNIADNARIVEFLEFRFSVGYEVSITTPATANHESAVSHLQDLTAYINKLMEGTMLGPFENPPFKKRRC